MFNYILRRILLFIPTIIGATLLVYGLMYMAPVKITDTLLPPDGQLRPEVREEREAYFNERFGLNDPFLIQYARWLNNASPVGLPVWKYNDPEVVESRAVRRAWRAEAEKQLLAEDPTLGGQALVDAVTAEEEQAQAAGEVNFSPRPGQVRFDQNPIKGSELGYSFVWNRPAYDLIVERLPITLLLNAISIPLALGISILTGVWSAKHRGGWQDWGTGTLLLGLYSIPVIWAGVMMIGFLANAQYIDPPPFPPAQLGSLEAQTQPFFPGTAADGGFRRGYLLDSLWHLVLPVLCLTYAQFAYLSKLTRTSMLETLGSDFVRTARAKGLSDKLVVWRHAFRNSLGPIITVLASLLPAVIAGSVVVERIFSIDGMGSLAVESLLLQDRELFLSLTLVTLILTIISYLIADLAYAAADPRVSYE